MLTLDKGAVKSFVLPENFVEGEEEYGGMGVNWRRQYLPQGHTDIEITSYYRGRPAAPEDSDAFRQSLAKPAHEIYQEGLTDPAQAKANLQKLDRALGNAGDNQITNANTGLGGPRFHIESARTMDINGRRVIVVTGWYHGPNGELHNHYTGVFFDGSPAQKTAQIEELVYQASTKELYDHYFPAFWQSLNSITWN